jgi:hypothetical protein
MPPTPLLHVLRGAHSHLSRKRCTYREKKFSVEVSSFGLTRGSETELGRARAIAESREVWSDREFVDRPRTILVVQIGVCDSYSFTDEEDGVHTRRMDEVREAPPCSLSHVGSHVTVGI